MTTPAPAPAPPAPDNEVFRSAPILPLLAIGFGAYLLWFGVKYWKGSGSAVWPSYPVRSVLEGQGVPPNQSAAMTATERLAAFETPLTAAEVVAGATPAPGTSGPTGTGQAPGTTTAGGRGSGGGGAGAPVVGSNANRGRLLAAGRGWTGSQFTCLNNIVQAESGWDNRVWNGGSTSATRPAGSDGGYGIAQATPYTKMPKAGWPPGYGGRADPNTQISWMLSYIAGRYGTPCNAWAYHQQHGIY